MHGKKIKKFKLKINQKYSERRLGPRSKAQLAAPEVVSELEPNAKQQRSDLSEYSNECEYPIFPTFAYRPSTL